MQQPVDRRRRHPVEHKAQDDRLEKAPKAAGDVAEVCDQKPVKDDGDGDKIDETIEQIDSRLSDAAVQIIAKQGQHKAEQ